jgi:hypothetical protein
MDVSSARYFECYRKKSIEIRIFGRSLRAIVIALAIRVSSKPEMLRALIIGLALKFCYNLGAEEKDYRCGLYTEKEYYC